jgi:hypothetical protein
MKKNLKKLRLSRETLSALDSEHLSGVEGGISTRPCSLSCDSCARTCDTCFPC